MAEVELPTPLSLGVVKGLLLRHLRSWANETDMFNADGTLSIGFCYPNMFMCEDYNSPQSVYWCLKSFCAVALPADHPFWTCEELPHPLDLEGTNSGQPSVKLLNVPKQILCDTKKHHFLLSSGQYCGWPLKATEAKYSKFAYSSTFGFSVPTGPLIQQMAPDSMLSLSDDEGETWKLRWKSQEPQISSASIHDLNNSVEEVPVLVSTWQPWKDGRVEVETTLIPPSRRWPDWHVRVHKLLIRESVILDSSTASLVAVEAGFAIFGRSKLDGGALPVCDTNLEPVEKGIKSAENEGTLEDGAASLIVSCAGASGIKQIVLDEGATAKGEILKPDSNTNLMTQRTLIPTVRQTYITKAETIAGTKFAKTNAQEVVLAVAVFAISGTTLSKEEIRKRWDDPPKVGSQKASDNFDSIVILHI
jgi:hypothetical protein